MRFKGKKYLDSNKNYFEGWYFKNSTNNKSISFIPGISINNKGKYAFIQVITNDRSYNINYSIDKFSYGNNPFYVKIDNNYFFLDSIHIDIKDKDKDKDLAIYGDINYTDSINIKHSLLSPSIMGIFSYVSIMECNHSIGSMRHSCKGMININGDEICFNNGIGYIEKDWGCSFPSSYIWCQGNQFENSNGAFMISIATIPLGVIKFKGLICSLIVDGKEYRFATYNGTKIVRCDIDSDMINIVLKKRDYCLKIFSKSDNGHVLNAPVKGEMSKNINECINGVIRVILVKGSDILFDDVSINCGVEVVL